MVSMRARARVSVLASAAVLLCTGAGALASEIDILFVGNSFTHGKYDPVLSYNAGPGNSNDPSQVHDLLCPTLPCTGAEAGPHVNPTTASTPGATMTDKLNYLSTHSSSAYKEVGPYSGVAGIFKQFTTEAGLNYNVSTVLVSSATLSGWAANKGSEAGDLPLIANSKYSQVVLQEQSFRPLPTTVMVNGNSVPTRGDPAGFRAGVNSLVTAIDAADKAAGKSNAAITLYQTQPLASYGYTSNNPNAPIFGSSTMAANGNNPAYAPYIGAADPIAQMALDLHVAYATAAQLFNAANPNLSHISVAFAGDAWVTAIKMGIAQQNPYLVNEPAGQISLWDTDPLLACCTTPIGYHPSKYGSYLNALVLFGDITGVDPTTLFSEFDPLNANSAANALGIAAPIAYELAIAAESTIQAGVPEPSTWAMLMLGFAGIGLVRYRRSRGKSTTLATA